MVIRQRLVRGAACLVAPGAVAGSALVGPARHNQPRRLVASLLVLAICVAALVASNRSAAESSAGASMYAMSEVDGCSNAGEYVSVGGTAGFNTLVNPDFTTALLATGHVRLYEHATAIAA